MSDLIKKNWDKKNDGAGFSEFGKIPPQAVDIEEAIIGAILMDSDAFFRLAGLIEAEMFYKDAHVMIIKAMKTLNRALNPIDVMTVGEQLKSDGNLEKAGGFFYLADLTNKILTSANIEYHAKIVAQKYIQRQVIKFCSTAVKECFDDTKDVFEIIDQISDNLRDINNLLLEDDKTTWKESTENYVIELKNKLDSGIDHTGIRLGLTEVDATLQGVRSGVYIIGGRSSMGKTAFALDLARRIAVQKIGKVGIFSLEMSKSQLINRIVAGETGIDQTRLMNANIYQNEINNLINGGERASELDFLVNDKSTISISQIISKAKVWANKNKLSAIFVDYVQLVKGTSPVRHLEIGEISRGLKLLSKDLDIPVFALAQLGREKDAGKSLPMMSELRESGDLEQDADCVILLYRPEYYKIDVDADGKSTKGLTKVIIAKHRNGAVNIKGANVRSHLAINRYEDWDYSSETFIPEIEKKISQQGGEDKGDFAPF